MASDLDLQSAAVILMVLQIDTEADQRILSFPVRSVKVGPVNVIPVKASHSRTDLVGAVAKIQDIAGAEYGTCDLENAVVQQHLVQLFLAEQITFVILRF